MFSFLKGVFHEQRAQIVMKDVTKRSDAKKRHHSTFGAVRWAIMCYTLNLENFQRTLDATPFTSEEYEALLVACLSIPSETPLRWHLLYQSAEKHGVQPSARILVHKLAEMFEDVTKETLVACLHILQERAIPLDTINEHGMTPLLYAFKHYTWTNINFEATILPWFEAGASMTATDSAGNTFLHYAGMNLSGSASAVFCCIEGIRFLLKQGADVMACNHEGVHAHEAVRQKLLMERPYSVSEEVHNSIESLLRELDAAVLQRTLSPTARQGSSLRRRA